MLCCRGWGQCCSWSPPAHRDVGSSQHWCHSKVAADARCSGSGPLAGVPVPALSYPYPSQNQNVAVWSQEKLIVPMSCSPLAHTWDGAVGAWGSHHCWALGWVFHTEGAGGQAWSTLIDILGAKCPWVWIFGCSLEFCAGKPPLIAVPLPELDGHYWSIREESEEQKLGDRATPQRCTEMSPRLSFQAVLPKPPGPLSRVFRDRSWPGALHASSGSLWTHTLLTGEGPKHTSSRICLWLMQLRSITQNISHMT